MSINSFMEGYRWEQHAGRNRDGDRFEDSYLIVEATGRILARIGHPTGDEYSYVAEMNGAIYGPAGAEREFIDLESARAFCEATAPRLLAEEAKRDELHEAWFKSRGWRVALVNKILLTKHWT